MRSTVSIKGMMVALVIFFIGVYSFFHFFLYLPKKNKARKGTREISLLHGRVANAIQEHKKITEETERVNKEEVNVDYFKRHQIPPEERTPTFLKNIDRLAGRLGFKTNAVTPMDGEETTDYIRYPFLVETRSKYREIVQFIDSLENILGLNLDDLHIENDPKDPSWHRLKFTVSTFELKRAKSLPSDKPGKMEVPPIQMVVKDDIAVKRDPFLEKKLEGVKRVATAAISKERPKRLPRLKLNGIIDIAGKKVAIINNKIIREGDWIARYRILQIGEDKVIVIYGRKKRTLKIKELVKTK